MANLARIKSAIDIIDDTLPKFYKTMFGMKDEQFVKVIQEWIDELEKIKKAKEKQFEEELNRVL